MLDPSLMPDRPRRRAPGARVALVAGLVAAVAFFVWGPELSGRRPFGGLAAVAFITWFVVRMIFVIADAIATRPR